MSDSENKFHEYDGIVEHDNPLPTWWLWTFFLTIIFGFLYFIHYEFGGGQSLQQELQVAMTALEKQKASMEATSPVETEDALKQIFAAGGVVKAGGELFATKCTACHGQQLQGLIGPNLTDDYWLHGQGTRMDIVKTIREGVPDKGMPPWGPSLKREEIYSLAAFILSKHGSNPPGAKPPQGNKAP
ncbi:MAG TPA: cbb3-type cytochrome c oxidase N-terminal domain-containing protein [Bdellovibrio sp.]|uniref:cbb3-type cytochrome c oxidase N-terminal domain-containing protein n=1 Tax=Bdellovibrio sp. TaxID=28201 RepID=UPI002EF5B1AC